MLCNFKIDSTNWSTITKFTELKNESKSYKQKTILQ